MSAVARGAACAACDAPLDPAEPSCRACGSPAAPAQRRVVTVLFADLVGYTSLSASLDPEEVHLLVRPLMNRLRAVCESHDGLVQGIEGDGFMAVFGARHADPDDPLKALLAATRLQQVLLEQRHGLAERVPALRVGVHLGEVLVAPSWESSGVSVSGDVVNVAKRLCDVAPAGQVLVSRDLRQLVDLTCWGEESAYRLKNRDEQVWASHLLWQELSTASSRRSRRAGPPLTGREQEQQVLADGVQRGPVLVLGEAGVGKTRLVDSWLAGEDADVVLHLACTSFDTADERDTCRALLRAVPEDLLGRAVASLPEQAAVAVSRLLEGQDVTLTDAVGALGAVVAVAAQATRTVFVAEDLHWAGPSTAALLSALAPVQGLTVVATARAVPEHLTGLGWHELPLAPLSAEASRSLVEHVLPGAPETVVDVLVARSGGLPLFLEQGAQLLLDNGTVRTTGGVSELVDPAGLKHVPSIMRLFVGARLDRLGAQVREVLATASVLGEYVDPQLLESLVPGADAAVERLVELGHLQWVDEPRPSGRREVRFRHAVVRDVAYEGVLRRTRLAIHCAAADWYALLPVREMLKARAMHLTAAIDLAPPDCGLAREAADAMTAWAQAILVERPREALDVLSRLIALDAALPQCDLPVLRAHLALAQVYELLGHEGRAAQHAETARQLALATDDHTAAAEALLAEARALTLSDPTRAAELLQQAEAEFLAGDDRPSAARVDVERAILLEREHGLGSLVEAHRRAHRVGVMSGDSRLVAHSAQQLAFLSITQSAATAAEWLDRAELAARPDDEVGRATLELARCAMQVESGELEAALVTAEVALEAARAAGSDFAARNVLILAADAASQASAPEQAEQWLEELRRAAASRPNQRLAGNLANCSALVAARSGRPEDADAHLADSRAIAEQEGLVARRFTRLYEAQVLAERGAFEEALTALLEVEQLDARLEQPLFALRARLLRHRARVAARLRVSLSEGMELPRLAQQLGAPALAELASLWTAVDDVLNGEPQPHVPAPSSDGAEQTALRLEVAGLLSPGHGELLEAAAAWATLGDTVWAARSLFWYEELTGSPQPQAHDVLVRLGAPEGTAAALSGQVSRLRR